MTIEEHLANRRMRDSSIVLGDDCCYFLLWTLSGKLVGVQKYNPDGKKEYRGSLRREDPKSPKLKYVTYVAEGEIGVWGLHTIKEDSSLLFITEGIFDAAMIHNAGYPAIALLGNDQKQMKPWLRMLPYHKIAICDNDKAGLLLAKYGDEFHTFDKAKDLNDASEEDANSFIFDIVFCHEQRKHFVH